MCFQLPTPPSSPAPASPPPVPSEAPVSAPAPAATPPPACALPPASQPPSSPAATVQLCPHPSPLSTVPASPASTLPAHTPSRNRLSLSSRKRGREFLSPPPPTSRPPVIQPKTIPHSPQDTTTHYKHRKISEQTQATRQLITKSKYTFKKTHTQTETPITPTLKQLLTTTKPLPLKPTCTTTHIPDPTARIQTQPVLPNRKNKHTPKLLKLTPQSPRSKEIQEAVKWITPLSPVISPIGDWDDLNDFK